MFLVDQKGENAQVLDTVKLPTCTHLDIKHDVTLRGGIKSGNFTKLGYLRDMQTCIDACCQDEKCDVAFMPGHVCYSVSCFSAKLCESIPAIPSIAANRSVRISHVVRGGGKGDDLEQFKKTQGMEKYSKRNDVILSSSCTVKSSRKKKPNVEGFPSLWKYSVSKLRVLMKLQYAQNFYLALEPWLLITTPTIHLFQIERKEGTRMINEGSQLLLRSRKWMTPQLHFQL